MGQHERDEGIVQLKRAFDLFSAETRRIESAYQALEKTLAALMHHLPIGILFIAPDGSLRTANPSAERFLAGVPFSDTLFGFSLKETLASGKTPATTYPTGFGCDLEVTPRFVEKEGLILILRDVTRERAAHRNERLQELGEMAAAVAHEIRNPLGGIKGFASLLVRDLEGEPKKMAQAIVQGASRLDQVVTHVLHYARPLQPRLSPTDLGALMSEVCNLLALDPHQQEITFQLDLPSEKLEVPVDPELVRAALLNLAMNGIQAMPEGGTLTLRLEARERLIAMSVIDRGPGISPEHREKIFAPFYSTKETGSGLGLAETHKIVRAHEGRIEIESTPDAGTTFTIQLPRPA